MSSIEWESVRIAPEILAKLEAEGSEPVHIIGVYRHEDGTLDMTFRTPYLAAENRRLRDLCERAVEALRFEANPVCDEWDAMNEGEGR